MLLHGSSLSVHGKPQRKKQKRSCRAKLPSDPASPWEQIVLLKIRSGAGYSEQKHLYKPCTEQMTMFMLPNMCCREWASIPQQGSPLLSLPGTDCKITGKEFRIPELLKGSWITRVEVRSKIPPSGKGAAPHYGPGQEGQVQKSSTRQEESGELPAVPRVKISSGMLPLKAISGNSSAISNKTYTSSTVQSWHRAKHSACWK